MAMGLWNYLRGREFRKALSVSESGFTIHSSREEGIQILWEEVLEILAFKREYWTTDMLCFTVRLPGNRWIELNEEMTGWGEVTAAFSRKLPGFDKAWFAKIYQPPVEPSATRIYSKL